MIVSPVEPHGKHQRGQRQDQHPLIDHGRIKISGGHLIDVILNIGCRQVRLPQRSFDLPVPVGERAIPEAVEHPEADPGKKREPDAEQMKPPRRFPDPPDQIKRGKRGMKNEKEPVQKYEHVRVISS